MYKIYWLKIPQKVVGKVINDLCLLHKLLQKIRVYTIQRAEPYFPVSFKQEVVQTSFLKIWINFTVNSIMPALLPPMLLDGLPCWTPGGKKIREMLFSLIWHTV